MNLYETISADFMAAYKQKNMEKKNFLGVIKGEVQTQIGKGIDPTDENVIKVIKKIEKSLLEINSDESKKELEYLTPYLPKMMGEDELMGLIKEFIGSDKSINIGTVMKHFNQNYKGLVDNKMVQELYKQIV